MKKAKRFIIKGMVQGVGFRFYTNNLASRIGVAGYVKNKFDGSVEVYAIGTEEQLKSLRQVLYRGPSYSNVSEIIEQDMPVDDTCRSFNITF